MIAISSRYPHSTGNESVVALKFDDSVQLNSYNRNPVDCGHIAFWAHS